MSTRSQPLASGNAELMGKAASEREPPADSADICCLPDTTVLEDAIENCQDCIALVDLDGSVAYMNFFGLCQLRLDGSSQLRHCDAWSQLWSRTCVDLVEYGLESVRSGRACRIVVHRPDCDGKPQWWDIAASPVFDRCGNPTQMFCVCREARRMRRT